MSHREKERVIIDFKNLEDASKVEETVKTGYCDVIMDNLTTWAAVEEDIIDSYTGLANKADSRSGPALKELAEESRRTLRNLKELRESIQALSAQRTRRIQKLRELMSSS